MKKLIILVLLSLITRVNAQTIEVKVKEVQFFSHDTTIETEDAVVLNKINYGDGGTTTTTYLFDLSKKLMYRKVNGENFFYFKIISFDTTIHMLTCNVKFDTNNGIMIGNYTITKDPSDDGYILMCRYKNNGRLEGWFSKFVTTKKTLVSPF